MQTTTPAPGQTGATVLQLQNSVKQAVDNNVEITYPTHLDANAWPDLFTAANVRCTAIRVGALGTTPPSQIAWTGASTKIPHNLGRQPIGWIVVYKDKTCDVFAPSTTKNDEQFIYLSCTDTSANVTLVIF